MTAPVAPGFWWITSGDQQNRSIALVDGDHPTAEEQTAYLIGGGFRSVAFCKAEGIEFLKPVAAMEEGR